MSALGRSNLCKLLLVMLTFTVSFVTSKFDVQILGAVRVKAEEILYLPPFERIPWSSLGTQILFLFFHLPFYPTNSFTELRFSRGDIRSLQFCFIRPKEPNWRCSQVCHFLALKLLLNLLLHCVTRRVWLQGWAESQAMQLDHSLWHRPLSRCWAAGTWQ